MSKEKKTEQWLNQWAESKSEPSEKPDVSNSNAEQNEKNK